MITVKATGDFSKTKRFLGFIIKKKYLQELERFGKMGVEALENATPKDTGLTASSWSYEIQNSRNKTSLIWTNSNINDGVSVAILIQYGHVADNGYYVRGVDYINPALAPVFEKIAQSIWMEVTNA